MNQYQTFPNTIGSSKSVEKLKALKLPPLKGLSFLDVGCNEGFFCGYAKFQGAQRVMGLDQNQLSISHAKLRFPDINFICQSWEEPIIDSFDCILLASALHYAKDQKKLIDNLVDLLTAKGTLVLEIGLSKEVGDKWVAVKRSIDERLFPTHSKLASLLEPYAWKIMGPSVDQAGDPLSRVVVHVSRRLPYAFLLLSPSGYGKTTISRKLSSAKDLNCVSGDILIRAISQDSTSCSAELKKIVKKNYTPTDVASLVNSIFKLGLGEKWIDVWLSHAHNSDVIIDSYVPEAYWGLVIQYIKEKGFAPIQLSWNLIGPKLVGVDQYNVSISDYVKHLEFLNERSGNHAQLLKPSELPLDFNAAEYLSLHPDVARAGSNPEHHYLNHGRQEGRKYKKHL